MKFWAFLGELFFFRWLFGTHGHSEGNADYPLRHTFHRRDNLDDFLDEQEDFDMMDDL